MNRRDFMGVGAVALLGCSGPSEPTSDRRSAATNLRRDPVPPRCPRAAHQTAGPFFVKEPIMRSRIDEGQAGRRLRLRLQIIEAGTCTPLPGVLLSLFHANASGIYSGFAGQGGHRQHDTHGATWLRGAQRSDQRGWLEFETIYPGWYTGRVTHVHVTASYGDELVGSSQLYFPDDVMREVYARAPYSGWRDTEDGDDSVRKTVRRGVMPRFAIERAGKADVGSVEVALAVPGHLKR